MQTKLEGEAIKSLQVDYGHRVPAPAELFNKLPQDFRRQGITEVAAKLILSRYSK